MSGHLALPCEAEGRVPDGWGVSAARLCSRLTRSSSALLILLPIRTGGLAPAANASRPRSADGSFCPRYPRPANP
jgi:hypothetical protein